MGRKKSITDEQLLSIARDVFVEKGIAASTRQIAHAAGISEAVIYQRFAKKSDLFFAAMSPPAVDLRPLLDPHAPRPEGETVPERLQAIAFAMLDYFRELMPILLPLMTHPAFDYEDFASRHPESPLTLIREGLMEYLQHQAALGTVRSESIDPTGITLVATLHSLALFEKLGVHGGHFDQKMVRAIVNNLWLGLKSEEPS